MTIVKQTSYATIFASLNTTRGFIWILTLSTILASLLINLGFVNQYSRRIRQIMQIISQIKRHNFHVTVPLDMRKDELSDIQASFGEMCDSINDYINRAYVAQLQKKTAELNALQFQINPHFLYNTLEGIRMYALDLGGGEVSEMIFILSQIFRESVKSEMVVSLSDEVSSTLLFVKLFQLRYSDKLSLDINIAPEAEDCAIVRLLLQPLVENYIIHGFDQNRDDNLLRISGGIENDIVTLKIEDNGKGISHEKQQKLFAPRDGENGRIGLYNVAERVKLTYGNDAVLRVESNPGMGTLITLRFQKMSKEELRSHVQGPFD